MPTNTSTKSPGRRSQQNLLSRPRLTLRLYDGYATLTRPLDEDGAATVEYAIDPSQLAGMMATDLALHSGFLPPDIIWLSKRMKDGRIASYRPPQRTGIWLEGTEVALRVPMPGLILVQQLPKGSSLLFAVKEPPHQNIQLFAAPLPNVSRDNGGICWGSVAKAELDPEAPNDLTPIWTQFFSSAFINHDVTGKSERQPEDIRRLLIELDNTAAEEYPLDDLQPALTIRGNPYDLNYVMAKEIL